ncbi:hypothetical protein H4219_005358 [Mycoemilia scoparia]|uniref:Uncharacterized protein n=1 Tax=Mycoemilia scoparia TaxID=417184 RepID=A0A9W7ZU91_9FUNG|nr:hypothetical protein H4219_005358 [Mycoemilia scoparia]
MSRAENRSCVKFRPEEAKKIIDYLGSYLNQPGDSNNVGEVGHFYIAVFNDITTQMSGNGPFDLQPSKMKSSLNDLYVELCTAYASPSSTLETSTGEGHVLLYDKLAEDIINMQIDYGKPDYKSKYCASNSK